MSGEPYGGLKEKVAAHEFVGESDKRTKAQVKLLFQDDKSAAENLRQIASSKTKMKKWEKQALTGADGPLKK